MENHRELGRPMGKGRWLGLGTQKVPELSLQKTSPAQEALTVEAEKCRPISTLSEGQIIWRLRSKVAHPNPGCDCLVCAVLTGGQDVQVYFCSFFSNYEVTWGGACHLDHRMLMIRCLRLITV